MLKLATALKEAQIQPLAKGEGWDPDPTKGAHNRRGSFWKTSGGDLARRKTSRGILAIIPTPNLLKSSNSIWDFTEDLKFSETTTIWHPTKEDRYEEDASHKTFKGIVAHEVWQPLRNLQKLLEKLYENFCISNCRKHVLDSKEMYAYLYRLTPWK
jgi:hypothetical protein